MASRIEDYGLIGNTRTAALVSRSGSIDWLCAPRFDSDALFASLIGYDEHGTWSLTPTVPIREKRQQYRPNSLVLETEFVCDGGAVRITDFMPIEVEGEQRCDIVRVIDGVEGEVQLEMVLNARFGYGAYKPLITGSRGEYHCVAGPDAVALHGPIEGRVVDGRVSALISVRKGARLAFHLIWHPSHEEAPRPVDTEASLNATDAYWRNWANRCTYEGQYKDLVVRSLLTLKALTYGPTGGIVAAPTTSLPECIGGVRNWDYRFCWLRDSSLTLDALMLGGYIDEARAFRDWLIRTVAGEPEEAQIMYDITGARRLTEFELPWLPGYEGSRPVHVGNAASGQFQLDVYGEALSCIYAARRRGLGGREEGWPTLRSLIQFMERAWQMPDDGIWEVRGGRRHFTHSKVMAWVAIDRAARFIEEFSSGNAEARSHLPHLHALRERIHAEICDRGFNPRVGAFTQSYGSEQMDASVLVIPHYGFLPADDPRMKGTVAAVEKHLLREGFVLRYDTTSGADGLPGVEGAFLACTFWLADNYAFAGRVDEAEALFERLMGLRNHLGLYAEEYDPTMKRQIGNFPQGFSHLAFITTARAIDLVRQGGSASEMIRGSGAEAVH
ncbi:MAG TPA: glycoside hydrolase family 15 protein [Polyangia bacterium]|jgi:GH15 family glucan-1,4-alpha-glucosidase|nr:glycoside hydrolase family 15 protein [Polyangia bacterium]